MGDMREKVARAICRARQWNEDGFWKTASPDASAALEACHFEELVEALKKIATGTEDEMPHYRGLGPHEMQRLARDALAKVEASDE